jgi:glucokinase
VAVPLLVGVDVGGSKVLAVELGTDGSMGRTSTRVTPGRAVESDLVEETLALAVADVAAGRPVAAVGVAAAGFVDATGERVRFAPHLPWRDEEVRQRLEDRFGTRVVLDNDANCAALAELASGAAAGARQAVVVTMGTGIGGAVVVDGRVVRGHNGMAGEFGHTQVVPDGHPCECGHQGCWEQYSSGNALVRLARSRLGHEPTLLEELCGADPERLSGPMISRAAEDGDLVARQAFASVGDWLGVGLANLVAVLDPEVVVVGGGVSAAGDRLLDPARGALRRALVGAGHRVVPPVRQARYGPEAGAVGAVFLARERFG